MQRTYKFHLDTGYPGCDHEETVILDLPDEANEVELHEVIARYAKDWAWNWIELSWEEVPSKEETK